MPRTGNDKLDIQELYESLMWILPSINPGIGQIEPPTRYKRTGLIAYADGTNWNPNSQGAGHYRYDGTNWVKLIEPDDTFFTNGLPGALVWEKTVSGSAVTSVTTNGEATLDGAAHGGYNFDVSWTPGGTTACNLRIFVNNDTTTTNYYSQRIQINNTTVAGARENDPILSANSGSTGVGRITGSIEITPSGEFMVNAVASLDVASTLILRTVVIKKSATVANITRLDFYSEVASYIGVNSRFRLWRRK